MVIERRLSSMCTHSDLCNPPVNRIHLPSWQMFCTITRQISFARRPFRYIATLASVYPELTEKRRAAR
jgi:hypothetical protein